MVCLSFLVKFRIGVKRFNSSIENVTYPIGRPKGHPKREAAPRYLIGL